VVAGPVADHLAVEPVWRNHETLLISDGGSLFASEAFMEREARMLGKRWLIASFKTDVMKGAYWGIASARSRYDRADRLGYTKDLAQMVISAIPTDLDALSEAEAAVLENHGYLLADAAVATHVPDIAARPVPPLAVPHPEWMDERRARKALTESRRLPARGRW
jgi:NTE family protein